MRRANVIVAEVLQELKARVAPGVTTLELDAIAEEMTLKKKAVPAFKGYSVGGPGLSALLVCFDQRGDRSWHSVEPPLREGDIIGLDYGVIYEGFYGDSAITVAVGKVSEEAQRLMDVTEHRSIAGIEQLQEGKRLGDLGAAVQKVRRECWVFRCAGVCRSWYRQEAARRAAGAELRRAGSRSSAERRNGPGDRADGQCRQLRSRNQGRRLDGGYQRR